MIKNITIKVDLDGVLADFSGALQDRFGMNMRDHRKQVWGKIMYYNDKVEPWFYSLPKMSDADQLWAYLTANFENVGILTACGTTPRDAAGQKKAWVGDNYGYDINIICVAGGSDKAEYAEPNVLLIDDRQKVLNPFLRAGGLGVLHTSAASTIAELKRMADENDWE